VNVLEILKVLERSNCGECRKPSCMAFATAVLQGQSRLEDCPRLDAETLAELQKSLGERPAAADWNGADALGELRARFGGVDLAARAERLDGFMQDGRLAFHCLGKLFALDQGGGLHSDCHQNPWLHVPLLAYVLDSAGRRPAGDWARFAELKPARPWERFFAHRCEAPLLELAGSDPDLMLDILDLFASRRDIAGFEADQTFLLLPLPKVPFLFAYHRPEEGLPANMSVYLERSAEVNLDPESLFRLGSGMAQMFARIAARHGQATAVPAR